MLCKLAAVVVGVTANLVLSCSDPARQSPARGAAQRNSNAPATLVTLLHNGNPPAGSTRTESDLSAGTRWLQFRSGEAQYSLEDLLQRAPDLWSLGYLSGSRDSSGTGFVSVIPGSARCGDTRTPLINPRPWPGDAIIVVKPDPTIDYKIRVVKPDPSIDYKILIVGPPSGKRMPDLSEQLGEMLRKQPGPESQKRGR